MQLDDVGLGQRSSGGGLGLFNCREMVALPHLHVMQKGGVGRDQPTGYLNNGSLARSSNFCEPGT